MEINSNMIIDRIKTNLETLKIFDEKLDRYQDKLEELNEILRPTPKKHQIMQSIKKQRRYISIFLAIIREDLFMH